MHENAKAEAARKASPVVGASPITSRTRSKQNTGDKQSQDAAVSRPKGAVLDKKKIEEPLEDPSSEDIPTEVNDDDESEDGGGSGEDEFTSQRLVVRLTPKQEKKLEEGLKKIKQNSEPKQTPVSDSHLSKKGTLHSFTSK